jgi:hypothetical protein
MSDTTTSYGGPQAVRALVFDAGSSPRLPESVRHLVMSRCGE